MNAVVNVLGKLAVNSTDRAKLNVVPPASPKTNPKRTSGGQSLISLTNHFPTERVPGPYPRTLPNEEMGVKFLLAGQRE
jgi:hypothetical protein